MTAPTGRVYPVKVTKRDLELHRFSLAALNAVNRPDLSIVESTRTALRHRIACAERFEETRERPVTKDEALASRAIVLAAVRNAVRRGAAEIARANSRILVRVTRGVRW